MSWQAVLGVVKIAPITEDVWVSSEVALDLVKVLWAGSET